LLVETRLGVDIDCEFFLSCGLHGLLVDQSEMLEPRVLSFFRPKVPGKKPIVCAVKNLRNTQTVLVGHYLVVGIDVSKIFTFLISILFKVLCSIANLKGDALEPIWAEVSLKASKAGFTLE